MSLLTPLTRVLPPLLLLAIPGALAQDDDPLVGDRPDFTESAVTVAPGRTQVEAGATHTEADRTESQEFAEVLLRIGLGERIELRVGLNSYARVEEPGGRDLTGFVDTSLGAKIALGEAAGWTTAVLFGTTLPTGSTEFREPHPQPDVVLAAERDLTGSVSLGTNFGYAYASADGVQFGEAFASAALGVGLSETTGAFFEFFGFVRASAGRPETYFLDAGITKGLGPDFQLDLRVGTGLNSAADDLFVGAGLIWRK
jgi:hypothetical protein